MDATTTVLLSALGIVATCVGGLIWIVKYMFQNIMPMLKEINSSIKKNTKATESNDKYLRERNGRDNEVHTQLLQEFKVIKESIGG